MAITTTAKFIKYSSPVHIGKSHDFSILKTGFPPCKKWFKKFNIKVGLGYLGIAKEYECSGISIPHKKTKNNPLTELQKDENKQMASGRVYVENSFAGLKRFRTLSDRLRLHGFVLYDVILGVCAGLWNFYLANQLFFNVKTSLINRHPVLFSDTNQPFMKERTALPMPLD